MTMLSFRADETDLTAAQRWSERLGVDRSQLLRDALHAYLVRLEAEHEVDAWTREPMTRDEAALGEIADWGPAEDWSDWTDAPR